MPLVADRMLDSIRLLAHVTSIFNDRLIAGLEVDRERCRELIVEARDRAQATLATFAAIRAEISQEPSHAADAPYWLVTVSAGEHSARATVTWADEALAALDALEGSGRGGPRRRER